MTSRFRKLVKERLPFLIPPTRAALSFVRQQQSRRTIRRLLNQGNEIKIELGSGDKKGQEGWLTVDITKVCDIYWDLRKGLPFPNGTVSKIYSSHFFEHLSFAETRDFLQQCRRALKPGGNFLICVPNAQIYLEAYVLHKQLDTSRFYKPAYNQTTSIDYANYMAYMAGEHKYMFDRENLLYILSASGLRNARLRPFDPTLDMEERDFESIYAEAER